MLQSCRYGIAHSVLEFGITVNSDHSPGSGLVSPSEDDFEVFRIGLDFDFRLRKRVAMRSRFQSSDHGLAPLGNEIAKQLNVHKSRMFPKRN